MNDPGTYHIPSEFLRPDPVKTAESSQHVHENPAQTQPEAIDPATEIMRMTQEIGYLGDWVVHERRQKLESSELAIGLNSLWKKLGGDADTEKGLINKEARVSSELFADKRSNIFFFDKVGDGHGEWVVNRYDAETDDFITIYYEVDAGVRSGQGSVLVKWPGYQYRYASGDEVVKLHTITSRYYELITSRIYS